MSDYKAIIKKSYNSFAEDFNTTRQKPWKRVVKFLEEHIEKEALLLDAGSGNGRHGIVAKNLGYKVVSLDISKKMIKLAMNQHGGDLFIVGDLTNLPFKDNIFSYIISIASIHHLLTTEDRKRGIKELKRVIKKDGKALISVWKYEQPRFAGKGQNLDVKWRGKHPRPYHLFRKGELKKLMVEAKFKNVKEEEDEGNYWGMGEG